MIRWVRLQNFESHKDTKLKFGDGFNVIFGRSQSGKSSFVRALSFVAYGKWNPEFVRIGASYCRITCATDKGKVIVEKGDKRNEWLVVENGKKYKYENPGRKVPPKVLDVLGFGRNRIGGMDIGINISSQLDKHFLISEIDGQDVKASTASKIIDDLSGVRKAEELIDLIHADRNKHVSTIRDLSKSVDSELEKKYDEGDLEERDKLVTKLELLRDKWDACNEKETVLISVDERMEENEKVRVLLKKRVEELSKLKILTKKCSRYVYLDKEEDELSRISEGLNRNKKKVTSLKPLSFEAVAGVEEKVNRHGVLDGLVTKLNLISDEIEENRDSRNSFRKEEKELKSRLKGEMGKFAKWVNKQNVCPLSKGKFFSVCKKRIEENETTVCK